MTAGALGRMCTSAARGKDCSGEAPGEGETKGVKLIR
jgi:hypothetical protein